MQDIIAAPGIMWIWTLLECEMNIVNSKCICSVQICYRAAQTVYLLYMWWSVLYLTGADAADEDGGHL